MSDFAESMATAQEASQKRNPFGVILNSWNKAQSRRYEEDTARKKEEAELKNALISLGAKAEYDKAMVEEKGKERRKTGLLESLRKGEITETTEIEQGTFEGTPFQAITKNKSPSIQKQQIKDTSELAQSVKKGEETLRYVDEALAATDKIPQGKAGQINIGFQKMFNPKNPILGEWQKIKSVLSDLQLGKLQFTKGAISDREMAFFNT